MHTVFLLSEDCRVQKIPPAPQQKFEPAAGNPGRTFRLRPALRTSRSCEVTTILEKGTIVPKYVLNGSTVPLTFDDDASELGRNATV